MKILWSFAGFVRALAYHSADFASRSINAGREPQLRGAFAEQIGLQGPLSKPVFGALLRGQDPGVGEAFTPRAMKRYAIQFVLAWPKSVSIQALADPRLIDLNTRLGSAFALMMEEFAFCRDQSRGDDRLVRAQGLAVAGFEHYVSDARDPHLHRHDFVFLYSQFSPDGNEAPKRRAVWTTPIISNLELIEARVAATCARELRLLGYDLDPDGPSFRIRGVPRELEVVFSKRTNAIETAELDSVAANQEAVSRKELFRRTRSKRQSREVSSDKQDLDACRGELGEYRQVLAELAESAQMRAEYRSSGDYEQDAKDQLALVLARAEVLSPIQAEIEVLRATTGRVTPSTFSHALEAMAPRTINLRGFEYFWGGMAQSSGEQINAALKSLDFSPQEAVVGNSKEVSEYVVSANAPKCMVVLSGSPKKMMSSLSSVPGLRVEDATNLKSPELLGLIQSTQREKNRLVFCAPYPNRQECCMACATASDEVFERPLPLAVVSNSPHREAVPTIPLRARRIEAHGQQLTDALAAVFDAYGASTPPLVVTSSRKLAAVVNQWAHERAPKEITVARYSRSTERDIAVGAPSVAVTTRPHPGLPRGSVVEVHNEGTSLHVRSKDAEARMELFQRDKLTLLRKEEFMVGRAEPLFLQKLDTDSSAFSPSAISNRATVAQIAAGAHCWSFGYALCVDDLPERPGRLTDCPVVWCDKGETLEEPAMRKLVRYLHRSSAPAVLEFSSAPVPDAMMLHDPSADTISRDAPPARESVTRVDGPDI